MPEAHAMAAAPAAPVMHCARCGAVVGGTRHTRTGWAVGHYLLHGGRTVEGTIRRGDDEAPLLYRRLVEPIDVVSCPACLHVPEMRRRWLAWGEEEPGSA